MLTQAAHGQALDERLDAGLVTKEEHSGTPPVVLSGTLFLWHFLSAISSHAVRQGYPFAPEPGSDAAGPGT